MDPFEQLGKSVADAFNKNFSLTQLKKDFEAHIEEIGKVKQEVVPKLKDLLEKLVNAFVELGTEQDDENRALIQRKIGSLKRAHLSYIEALAMKAKWETAKAIWETVEKARDIVLAVIRAIPT